jgi:hypothetical protein
MHRSPAIAVVLVCAAASIAQAVSLGHEFPHVRVLHPEILVILEPSRAASPTLDALIAELEASDVIVHVVPAPRTDSGRLASMQWVTAAGGFRFLRIFINRHLDPRRSAAMLAHELQHAVEVVRAAAVVDAATFAALYRQIGEAHDHSCAYCYDTLDAQRTGQIVWEELRGVRFGF